MSTLKVDAIRHNSATSDAITTVADGTCTANITNNLSNRRININGGMQIWQRSTSLSVSEGTNEGVTACDRYGFEFGNASAGAATISRSTDVPTNLGFPYSFKIDVTTLNNNSANTTQIRMPHRIEAQDIVNSGWKYNDPNSFLTISFYFKSNKSGTNKLPIMVSVPDGTGYFYISEITQSDTNWNRHTIKVPGNANLTVNYDNGIGLDVTWYFAVGSNYYTTADTWGTVQKHGTSNSTNYFDSTSNEMFITGIQIEATSNGIATDFEHRSTGEEFARCQRYYQQYVNISAVGYVPNNGSRTYSHGFFFPVEMRSAPTMSITNTGSSNGQYITDGSGNAYVSSVLSQGSKTTHMSVSFNISTDLTDYRGAYLFGTGNTTYQTTYKIAAEL
tara:strand:+ start:525 stop:1694 length:1170 start_codon:yes stop_codon:yes gene_type:complete